MADRELTPPLVSINIPCYRQLEYARRCVQSILGQTLQDFEITLLDDGASDEYRDWVAALGDARLRYQRNPVRLGAMRNMFQAITAGRGRYTIAFHEDDLIGSRYLEAAVATLESDPACGFVGGELAEFDRDPSPADLDRPVVAEDIEHYEDGASFVRALARGVNPMFGSIVYRRIAVAGRAPAHQDYATLVDRPFLLDILASWSGAIVREPVVWYRVHGDGDRRHDAMTPEHILRLFARYRAALPRELSDDDRRLFFDFSGYWLFTLHRLVPPPAQWPLRRFALRAWRDGLYHPRWSRGVARKRLLGEMLTGR
ncbi:MAG TPA: glycosyltransferase family 2 protein [Vicinamibacterales bacterium]|nr:glycosyltransferase family 2 protein [Vicinamibacterales bacterium]